MSFNSDTLTYRLLNLMLNDEKSYDELTTFATTYNIDLPSELKTTMKMYELPILPSDIKVILELVRNSVSIEK